MKQFFKNRQEEEDWAASLLMSGQNINKIGLTQIKPNQDGTFTILIGVDKKNQNIQFVIDDIKIFSPIYISKELRHQIFTALDKDDYYLIKRTNILQDIYEKVDEYLEKNPTYAFTNSGEGFDKELINFIKQENLQYKVDEERPLEKDIYLPDPDYLSMLRQEDYRVPKTKRENPNYKVEKPYIGPFPTKIGNEVIDYYLPVSHFDTEKNININDIIVHKNRSFTVHKKNYTYQKDSIAALLRTSYLVPIPPHKVNLYEAQDNIGQINRLSVLEYIIDNKTFDLVVSKAIENEIEFYQGFFARQHNFYKIDDLNKAYLRECFLTKQEIYNIAMSIEEKDTQSESTGFNLCL